MEKIPKKAKKEGPDLESRLYGVEDMPSADETKLYMAKGGDEVKGLMNKVKGYWNDIKPRDIKDWVGYTVMPVPYYMWKLPPDLHKTMNDILGAASGIAMDINPEVGLAAGLAYGISQVVYGLKTGSGKHTGSGLIGIAEHIKRTGKEEHKPIVDKIEAIIENYFHGFKPAYATAH